jgi:hypothetical protein
MKYFRFFWLLYIPASICIGYFLYPTFAVLLLIWFLLFFIANSKKFTLRLSKRQKQTYITTILLYPLIELLLKFLILKNFIPYSWSFLNRFEHFFWAFSLTIALLPFVKKLLLKINKWEAFFVLLGLVVIIGNFNEFFEYGIRMKLHLSDMYHFSLYYPDTIFDLITNVIGGIYGSTAILFLLKRKNKIGSKSFMAQ